MGAITFNGSSIGTNLHQLLMAEDIQPGSSASYELCKQIYLYHPLGAKIVEYPINMAMSKSRDISVKCSASEMIVEQFLQTWEKLKCDNHIKNLARTSAIYGISSIVYLVNGVSTEIAIPLEKLAEHELSFNVYDPLNTSGSLVLNQLPLADDFQKPQIVAVNGVKFHPSRSCVLLNEEPIYISFTESAFGFVGRSAYQRALFPLKTYIQTMITDDLVTVKAGVLVAKIKAPGSFVDNLMMSAMSFKRNVLNEAKVGNTINIDIDEEIETLNMQNIDKAMVTARKNALENIAMAIQAPAKILNSETFAEGFGEGTEDAKNVARYITNKQKDLQPVFDWFDQIVMYTAWTPEFFEAVKNEHPEEFDGVEFTQAFVEWKNGFKATFPNFLIESDAEKIKTEEVKLKAIIALVDTLSTTIDPTNKADLIQWAIDNFNEQQLLFKNPLNIDIETLREYLEEHANDEQQQETEAGFKL